MFRQIEVRGDDAVSFLQGQLTQDVTQVSATRSPLAASCDPRGRVIAVLRLIRLDDGIGLVVPAAGARHVLLELDRYRFRARVTLAVSPDTWRASAVAADGDLALLESAGLLPGQAAGDSRADGGVTTVRLTEDPARVEVYGERAAFAATGLAFDVPLAEDDWRAARIAAGIADLTSGSSGRYTPHMLNLDRLGAVNFDKGCYTGQEVIARTQYRGNVKRRLAHYRTDAPIAVGDKLTRDGQAVGEVVSVAGGDFLALLPNGAADSALGTPSGKARPAVRPAPTS